ncbi:Mitoguardin [Lamellibrachia satsuma]|nr:Mitoguardin [Lamellibrachia satsuma]
MPGVLSNPVRLTVIGAGVGITLIGVLAMYFKRRRRAVKKRDPVVSEPQIERAQWRQLGKSPPSHTVVQTGDHVSSSSKDTMNHRSATPSVDGTDASIATITNLQDTSNMNSEQLCDLGLEVLQLAVSHWEMALDRLEDMEYVQDTVAAQQLREQLLDLVTHVQQIQDNHEQRLFHDVNTHVAIDVALQEMDREYELQRRRKKYQHSSSYEDSSDDSFMSAQEVIDLSDLDQLQSMYRHLKFYHAGLEALQKNTVTCRKLRTKLCNCQSDAEFLAKLHCLRLAFTQAFSDESTCSWFIKTGQTLLANLLVKSDRDPRLFLAAFEDMIAWLQEDHWTMIEDELHARGVTNITFYDVVLDFILFDSFDDLEAPPSSIVAVTQNRWLSNGFKETALSTAVWSVLKAKKGLLKYPRGFIARFYDVSEHISPIMAWGFLGPDGPLKTMCHFFKDMLVDFVRDIFSFEKVHYTTVEELAEDMVKHAHRMAQLSEHHLSL